MKQNIEEPTVHPGHHTGDTIIKHPAFGQIGVSRCQGGAVLYGSDFVHHAFMELTIRQSELHRTVARDWHHGHSDLLTVRMSESQWAAMLSSPNVGTGTPCTIIHDQHRRMPGIPLRQQVTSFKTEVSATVQKAVERIDKAIANAERELALVSKKRREAILDELRLARQDLVSNLPFVARSFGEYVENIIEEAKTEVHAYMDGVISRAGLQALGASRPLELQSGTTAPSSED